LSVRYAWIFTWCGIVDLVLRNEVDPLAGTEAVLAMSAGQIGRHCNIKARAETPSSLEQSTETHRAVASTTGQKMFTLLLTFGRHLAVQQL